MAAEGIYEFSATGPAAANATAVRRALRFAVILRIAAAMPIESPRQHRTKTVACNGLGHRPPNTGV